MDTTYIIEAEIAVFLLSLILSVYLYLIYSGTSSEKRTLQRYSYMTTLGGFIEILFLFVTSEHSHFSIETQYVFSIIAQCSTSMVFFMFMRYISGFGIHTPGKKKMFYAQTVMLGIYFYFQVVGIFTGSNFTISPDRTEILRGDINELLSFSFVLLWTLWTWFELYIYRRAFTKGQMWALVVDIAICWLIIAINSEFFPDIPLMFIINAVNVYYYFFLLETPA